MSRFVRASKVRHLFADEPKKENQFTDIRLSSASGDGTYVKGNSTFFCVAVRGGGGAVLVHPMDKKGRIGVGKPVIAGHTSAVLDFDWNPFNEHQLATASDDLTIKIFNIPEGGLTEKITDAAVTLEGHKRKVTFVKWHPTSSNVLASASADGTVRTWDAETGEEKTCYSTGEAIQDLKWNYDGSLLAVSCKNKTMHILDPRKAPELATVLSPHDGAKCSKIGFLGSTGKFVTVGFTKTSKRQMILWDSADMSKSISTTDLGSGSGVFFPYFDEAIGVLYLMGKGEGVIKYFEFANEENKLHAVGDFRSPKSAKGYCVCPKKGNNILGAEVTRILKLVGDAVIPLAFTIPRKSDSFQDDIFPDDYAGIASQSADDYFGGADKDPVKMSMNPKNAGDLEAAVAAAAASTKKKLTYAELEKELAAAQAKIAELEAALAAK